MALEKSVNDLNTVLGSLREQHEKLTRQITAVEALLAEMGSPVKRKPGRPRKNPIIPPAILAAPVAAPRRGRPPKNQSASAPAASSASAASKRRKRPHWSEEQRLAAAKRMKEIWADRRKSGR